MEKSLFLLVQDQDPKPLDKIINLLLLDQRQKRAELRKFQLKRKKKDLDLKLLTRRNLTKRDLPLNKPTKRKMERDQPQNQKTIRKNQPLNPKMPRDLPLNPKMPRKDQHLNLKMPKNKPKEKDPLQSLPLKRKTCLLKRKLKLPEHLLNQQPNDDFIQFISKII